MKLVKDPLLTAANILLVFLIASIGFGAVMLLIGGPASLLFQDRIVAEFSAECVAGAARMFPEVAVVLVALAALLGLAVWFLVLLRRIVRSVGEGDPFAPVNAERLLRMGWLALAGHLATLPIGYAVVRIVRIVGDAKDAAHMDEEFGFSPTGLLLILVLFILARVFKRGAEMRDELEGTV